MLDRLLDISTNLGVDTLLLLPVLIALGGGSVGRQCPLL